MVFEKGKEKKCFQGSVVSLYLCYGFKASYNRVKQQQQKAHRIQNTSFSYIHCIVVVVSNLLYYFFCFNVHERRWPHFIIFSRELDNFCITILFFVVRFISVKIAWMEDIEERQVHKKTRKQYPTHTRRHSWRLWRTVLWTSWWNKCDYRCVYVCWCYLDRTISLSFIGFSFCFIILVLLHRRLEQIFVKTLNACVFQNSSYFLQLFNRAVLFLCVLSFLFFLFIGWSSVQFDAI